METLQILVRLMEAQEAQGSIVEGGFPQNHGI
jgi:hypothetical protein